MTEARNVDSILVQDMQERATGTKPEPAKEIDIQHDINKEVLDQSNINQSDDSSSHFDDSSQDDPYLPLQEKIEVKNEENKDEPRIDTGSPIDEYGNPVEKPRLYTEEEVNQRIRERLSRGKYAQEQQQEQYQQYQQRQQQSDQQQGYSQQQVNQATADGFEHNPNSEESWEVQLERFIDQTIQKKERIKAEEQWKKQEYEKQMVFQDKFTSGMEKYKDFREVVSGKPITDSMMLATRNMDNPAAFVYAASKLHPQELDRISRIPDQYSQAAEIGKLHERMVKERRAVTNAPKPLNTPKGDLPGRVIPKMSIEQRIHDYAKQKRK